ASRRRRARRSQEKDETASRRGRDGNARAGRSVARLGFLVAIGVVVAFGTGRVDAAVGTWLEAGHALVADQKVVPGALRCGAHAGAGLARRGTSRARLSFIHARADHANARLIPGRAADGGVRSRCALTGEAPERALGWCSPRPV